MWKFAWRRRPRGSPKPRRMARTAALLVAVFAVAGGLSANPSAAVASDPRPQLAQDITWSPCPENPAVQCARLTLPVDWDDPKGATFQLAVARRPASGTSSGPLFVNPGGPGGSGVDLALQAELFFSPDLLNRFDIIGFDPRGVARSNPVACSPALLAQQGQLVLPANQTEFDRLVAFNRQLFADCRQRTGPLIGELDAVSTAHDIDAIRQALGAPKLNWFGFSYGTLMGQMYAEQYPQNIRTMVTDSVVDHSLNTRNFLLTQAGGAQESFDEFVAWCGRDSDCVLTGQDVAALFDGLAARAERGELRYADGTVLTLYNLIEETRGALYGPTWDILALGLADLLDDGVLSLDPVPPPTDFSFAAFCEDFSLPVRDHTEFSGLLAESRRVAPNLRTSGLAVYAVTSCLGWPNGTNNPQHTLKVGDLDVPMLLVNSQYDPATPYAWAKNVAIQLGSEGRFLLYKGWGHAVYPKSACVMDLVDDYLLSAAVPPSGTTCPAVEPPPATRASESQSRVPGSVPGRW
jgi:pimeloyl-ACP methyl ester carboxylesterase